METSTRIAASMLTAYAVLALGIVAGIAHEQRREVVQIRSVRFDPVKNSLEIETILVGRLAFFIDPSRCSWSAQWHAAFSGDASHAHFEWNEENPSTAPPIGT